MTKRIKKYGQRAGEMTMSGMGLGAGALAVEQMGGPVAAKAAGGLGTMAGFMPMMGTLYGAEATMGIMSDMNKKKKQNNLF